MSEQAQRILTSHKEAARRASTYLANTRKLHLKPTEALELVAQVLGARNWQTLLGLAKEGRAPRPGHESSGTTPVERAEGDNAPDALGETASAENAQRIARAADILVHADRTGRWVIHSRHPSFRDVTRFDTEEAAWWHAEQLVHREATRCAAIVWDQLSTDEMVQILTRKYCWKDNKGLPVNLLLRSVVMDELRDICAAASMVPREKTFKSKTPWTTDDRNLPSEEEALVHQAACIGKYVDAYFDWECGAWDWLPMTKKVLYARRHAAIGRSIRHNQYPEEADAAYKHWFGDETS